MTPAPISPAISSARPVAVRGGEGQSTRPISKCSLCPQICSGSLYWDTHCPSGCPARRFRAGLSHPRGNVHARVCKAQRGARCRQRRLPLAEERDSKIQGDQRTRHQPRVADERPLGFVVAEGSRSPRPLNSPTRKLFSGRHVHVDPQAYGMRIRHEQVRTLRASRLLGTEDEASIHADAIHLPGQLREPRGAELRAVGRRILAESSRR